MELIDLKQALEQVWSQETSYCPKAWKPNNRSAGQCLVTALIVQDHFGGTLVHGRVNKTDHWWNKLTNGSEIDLTIQQFGPNARLERDDNYKPSRKNMRAIKTVEKRYRLLYSRVLHRLLVTQS